MKKLILILLFIPLYSFSQEDIERYKVYETTNTYTSLLLDTSTGQIWHLQIGVGDGDQMKYVLSDMKLAYTFEEINEATKEDMKLWEEEYNSKPDSIVSAEDKMFWKPSSVEEKIESGYWQLAQNGRFELYPTGNMYNFILVDVIDGRTWQVQWNVDEENRMISRFY